jgi:hypothetical protein
VLRQFVELDEIKTAFCIVTKEYDVKTMLEALTYTERSKLSDPD